MSKKILITGSTDGIGKLAATNLAKDGHEVYLHGRSQDKLDAVINEIKEDSGNQNLGGYLADLSDLNAVRRIAREVNSDLGSLDVLINNAGVYKSTKATNEAGLDMRMVVNYLAPYVLTMELLSLISKGSAPRIINLSSAAQAPVSLDVLSGRATANDQSTYAQSKLALTMWSFRLAEQEKNITVIAVNPGSLLDTRMVKEAFGTHWSPPEKGADILHELAVAETHDSHSGEYFDNDKGHYGPAHGDAYDQGKIEQLMYRTESIILNT